MKIITLTKRNLLALFLTLGIGVPAIMVATSTAGKVIATVSTARDIPIYYVDRQEKVCALSFDAAWGNEQTEGLLDILDRYQVKSTFFLVGDWVEKYPDSVKEIQSHGHDIGNHSSTHPHMSELSHEEQLAEIASCNEKIKAITGSNPTLFRAPYGEYDNSVVGAVRESGMYCVQWNIDSLDWKDPAPGDMVARIKEKLCPGSIILMHNGAENTPEALPMIIECIREEGYRIVPISELLLEGDYETDHEGKMVAN